MLGTQNIWTYLLIFVGVQTGLKFCQKKFKNTNIL